MFRSGFKAELWLCFAWLAGFAAVGLASGYFVPALSVGLAALLVRLFVRIYQLEDWVSRTRRGIAPQKEELKGLWAEVAYDVQLLIAKHEKEKSRLQTVVHRVQEMTTALTDAVILIDRRGNMEWWNRAAEVLFDFREVDRGHKLTNLIRHPRFVQYFEQRDYLAPLELTLWREDQHLEFQVHAFGEGERLVIARDVTRLFRLEEMRKDFVANVSHELRTPLTVIRGYLETLTDSPQLPPVWAKAVQQMEQQSHRMTLLINDLITLAKLETDEKQHATTPVALAPMIADIIDDAQAVSGEHTFTAKGDETLAIIGNERELYSALSNLVINAINHSGNATRIDIKYKRLPNKTVVEVCDNGVGIDPKHLPRLTERFYRVDPSRSARSGGTGLGLAIVKHVLLRHNAELVIHSEPGKGSSFACHFPGSIVSQIKHHKTTAANQG